MSIIEPNDNSISSQHQVNLYPQKRSPIKLGRYKGLIRKFGLPLLFVGLLGVGAVVGAQLLVKKDSTTVPSQAAPEECYLTFSIEQPPEELTCKSLAANVTEGDFPLRVFFTAESSNPSLDALYHFEFGDGEDIFSTSSSVTHTYQLQGTYTASVKIKDIQGNWTPATSNCRLLITVNQPPEEFNCKLLSASVVSGKAPLEVEFSATATDLSLAESYRFSFGDGSDDQVTDLATATHTYNDHGTYEAFVLIKQSQGDWTEQIPICTLLITVDEEPPPPETRKICDLRDYTCITIYESGKDYCDSDEDCQPQVFEKRKICDWDQETCIEIIGSGADECSSDLDCKKEEEEKRKVCDWNLERCIEVKEGGLDLCSQDSDCATTKKGDVTPIPPQEVTTPSIPVPKTGSIIDTLKIIGAGALLVLAAILL